MRQVKAGRSSSVQPAISRNIFADSQYEIELVSLRGECKEATVWFGEPVSCLRRATRLPENVTWTDRDAPTTERVPASRLCQT